MKSIASLLLFCLAVLLVCNAAAVSWYSEEGEEIPDNATLGVPTSSMIVGFRTGTDIPVRDISLAWGEDLSRFDPSLDELRRQSAYSVRPLLNSDNDRIGDLLPRLSRLFVVEFAEPKAPREIARIDGVLYAEPTVAPAEEAMSVRSLTNNSGSLSWSDQWNLMGTSVFNMYGRYGLDCSTAWSLGASGNPAIKIGVLEGALACNIPLMPVEGGAAYAMGPFGPYFTNDYCELRGHSTNSASVIRMDGTVNDIVGVVGSRTSSSHASLYALNPVDVDISLNVSSLIGHAADDLGCQVISMSVAWTRTNASQSVRMAILDAYDLGVSVVTARGQTNQDNMEARYSWRFPACFDYSRILSVGSYGRQGTPCERYSGDGLDFAGDPCSSEPGSNQFSTKRGRGIDLLGPGEYIPAFDEYGQHMFYGGASAATPQIAGCVGLLRSYALDQSIVWRPEDYEGLLKTTAEIPASVSAGDRLEWMDIFGTGRANVGNAVTAMADYGAGVVYTNDTPTVSTENINGAGVRVDYDFDTPSISGIKSVEVIKVTAPITYGHSYTQIPLVWAVQDASVTGWSAASPALGDRYNRVVEGSQTLTGCDMETYVFAVYENDVFQAYYPCAPADVSYACRVLGPQSVVKEMETVEPANVQVWPNPFNPSTAISFDLAKREEVVVQILDVRGRLVRTLMDDQAVGRQHVIWDGCDNRGAHVPAGTYFAKIESNSVQVTRKLSLVK